MTRNHPVFFQSCKTHFIKIKNDAFGDAFGFKDNFFVRVATNQSMFFIVGNKIMVHCVWVGSALEFLSTCKLANLTVKAELGCCLLHRSGRLTIDDCVLQCESNPLDFLSCPIVSTASGHKHRHRDGVSVSQTRIEGGAKAVSTSGDLALQRVRVIYARTNLVFWFDMEHQ